MDVITLMILIGISLVLSLIYVGYGIALRLVCLIAGGILMFLMTIAIVLDMKTIGNVLGLVGMVLLCLSPIELWLREKLKMRRRLYT